jgi:hypothetical protein
MNRAATTRPRRRTLQLRRTGRRSKGRGKPRWFARQGTRRRARDGRRRWWRLSGSSRHTLWTAPPSQRRGASPVAARSRGLAEDRLGIDGVRFKNVNLSALTAAVGGCSGASGLANIGRAQAARFWSISSGFAFFLASDSVRVRHYRSHRQSFRLFASDSRKIDCYRLRKGRCPDGARSALASDRWDPISSCRVRPHPWRRSAAGAGRPVGRCCGISSPISVDETTGCHPTSWSNRVDRKIGLHESLSSIRPMNASVG